MSIQDLLANWEEELAAALSQPDEGHHVTEMRDVDLTNETDRRIASAGIRSNVHAGDLPVPASIKSIKQPWMMGLYQLER